VEKQNRFWLYAGVAAVFIVLLFFIFQYRHSPGYTTRITSKDTGESADVTPNVTPEKASSQNRIVLFGSYLILNNGATQAQYLKVQEGLSNYAQKNLAGKYTYLTLVPDSFKATPGQMDSKLRLGDTNNLVDIHVKIWGLKYVQVSIDDPGGKNGGHFDSGTLDATK
jgi:hypothetical protein